jgi:ankyrin repeat protein
MAESNEAGTDLGDAVVKGDVARVTALLEDRPERVRETAPSGHRWLSMAVRAGHAPMYTAVVTRRKRDLLMRLLDAGVRVSATPCGCRSYLLEDAEMLRLLVSRGGLDPDYADDTGATLLHALCERTDPEMTRIRSECAEILLAAGANVHARDARDLTPVDLAHRTNASDLVAVFARPGRLREAPLPASHLPTSRRVISPQTDRRPPRNGSWSASATSTDQTGRGAARWGARACRADRQAGRLAHGW